MKCFSGKIEMLCCEVLLWLKKNIRLVFSIEAKLQKIMCLLTKRNSDIIHSKTQSIYPCNFNINTSRRGRLNEPDMRAS